MRELSESIRARARELVEFIEARCAISLRELSDRAASVQRVLEDCQSVLSLQCAEVCRLRDDIDKIRAQGVSTGAVRGAGAGVFESLETSSPLRPLPPSCFRADLDRRCLLLIFAVNARLFSQKW